MDNIRIGNRIFDLKNKTYVMGILNITPDSFSDGGKYIERDAALRQAELMISEGADIIDIGGESTRPGYIAVSAEDQIKRVIPVLEAIKKEFDVAVSVDTYDAQVAKAAIISGCDLVNDIWGLKKSQGMAKVIADYDVACCLMHNKNEAVYNNLVEDVIKDLKDIADYALETGIKKERIILDPGVGFGKTYEHNLQIMNHMDKINELGYPVLLGSSRKSVIGLTLDLPVTEREEGTLATTVMAVMKGINFVRVHNVKANIRAIKMTEAILNS